MGAAVREMSGSTVRFMYCYTQVICRYWKEETFFRIFFETADRYTTGPLLEPGKYFRKKYIFSKSKNN